jgi:YD repeat-containing protein
VLEVLLSDLSPAEMALFCGPIQRFVLEDEQGRPRRFDRPEVSPPTDRDVGRMILARRALFSDAWNQRLMAQHAQQYQARGFGVRTDPATRRLALQDAAGAKALLQKTDAGVSVTTGLGRTWQYGLTVCKNPAWIIDPAGQRIEFDIQERENLVTRHKQSLLYGIRMEQNRKCWVLEYDRRNHLQSIDYPDGTQALFEHDPYGHLQRHTDRNGHTTGMQRDHTRSGSPAMSMPTARPRGSTMKTEWPPAASVLPTAPPSTSPTPTPAA